MSVIRTQYNTIIEPMKRIRFLRLLWTYVPITENLAAIVPPRLTFLYLFSQGGVSVGVGVMGEGECIPEFGCGDAPFSCLVRLRFDEYECRCHLCQRQRRRQQQQQPTSRLFVRNDVQNTVEAIASGLRVPRILHVVAVVAGVGCIGAVQMQRPRPLLHGLMKSICDGNSNVCWMHAYAEEHRPPSSWYPTTVGPSFSPFWLDSLWIGMMM